VKMMERAGYDRAHAAALTASVRSSAIIPPSIIMIIYCLQGRPVTPLGLFMAAASSPAC